MFGQVQFPISGRYPVNLPALMGRQLSTMDRAPDGLCGNAEPLGAVRNGQRALVGIDHVMPPSSYGFYDQGRTDGEQGLCGKTAAVRFSVVALNKMNLTVSPQNDHRQIPQ
nr:hypothetical protein [Fodinicurvata sediminis]